MGLMKPCLEVVPNRATTFAFGFLRKTKSRIEHIVTLVIDCLLPFGVGDFDACMRQPCAIGIVHNTVIQKISAKTHLCRRRHVRRKQEGEWERVRPRCHVPLERSERYFFGKDDHGILCPVPWRQIRDSLDAANQSQLQLIGMTPLGGCLYWRLQG